MKLLQSRTVDGVRITPILKPRATELKELSTEKRQARLEEFKAYKQLERKLKQKAEQARYKYAKHMLKEIPEVIEEEDLEC
jgi:hypothetical protein